jgi:hypothetical protein
MVEFYTRQGSCLPLLPRHAVHIWVLPGEGRRFVAVFRQAWRRLPLWARRRLLAHWKGSGHKLGVVLSPEVHLIDTLIEDDPRAIAGVNRFGHRLLFRSDLVAAVPDPVLQDVIAHELAHVLQHAWGIRAIKQFEDGSAVFACADGEVFGGNLEIELDADDTIEDWGFDPKSYDRWALETGLIRRVDISPVEYMERLVRHGR